MQPFWLETTDKEKLFCWHVLPLDVYLENENELVMAASMDEISDGLKGTVGEKLLSRDVDSRVVVNFHGVSLLVQVFPKSPFFICLGFFLVSSSSLALLRSESPVTTHLTLSISKLEHPKPNLTQNAGHLAQGYRPSTYRSISGIPHTHLLTCDYRGFGLSSLNNAPHIPTETGLITDAISLLSYVETTLNHPSSRTVLLGQSLGTAVTAASALYFSQPDSKHLPINLVHPSPLPSPRSFQGFAGIILVSPFTDLPTLLKTYKIGGILPILKPLRGYPRIAHWVSLCILDHWPTLSRLSALISSTSSSTSSLSLTSGSSSKKKSNPTPLHLHILHARNDQDIDWTESENLFAPLHSLLLASDHTSSVTSLEERRSIHGADRVRRGAFAYKKVENERGDRTLELEIVRFGGHNELVGWSPVGLAVRRAFERKSFRPGLDVE